MKEAIEKIQELTSKVKLLKDAYVQKINEVDDLQNKIIAHEQELSKMKTESENWQLKFMEIEDSQKDREKESLKSQEETEHLKSLVDACLKDIEELLAPKNNVTPSENS